MIATSGFLTAQECTKFDFSRGLAPDPAGRAYSAPKPPSWFKGPTSKERGEKGTRKEERGGRRKGRGGAGNGRNGKEGVGMPRKDEERGGQGRKERRGRKGREEK